MKEDIKIFEVGAEGGNLTIYKTTIQNRDYYYSNEYSGIDDFSVSNPESLSRKSFSFEEEFLRITFRYKNLLSLHPLFVHEFYRKSVIIFLKDYQLEKGVYVDYNEWAKVLNIAIAVFKFDNPTYSFEEYQILKQKYGGVSSWALWDENDEKCTLVIEENIGWLNSRYVGVGLNISKPVSTWSNFRGGKHDRKLKKAFNKGRIKGFYLTDVLKNIVEKNSTIIEQKIKNKEIDLISHITFFIQEMKDIKIDDDTIFLIFGNQTYDLFNSHLKSSFPKNKIVKLKHYSARGTDKEWVKSALEDAGLLEEYLNNDIFDENYFEVESENSKTYREHLIHTINNLINFEDSLFTDVVNVGMSNELKEINDCFEVGDLYDFSLEHLENSDDQNVNKLVDLIKNIRQTVDTIMNINNINESDR